ncbi:MAG: hypothetical protein AB1607_18545 [Chloroflexota bacterium]
MFGVTSFGFRMYEYEVGVRATELNLPPGFARQTVHRIQSEAILAVEAAAQFAGARLIESRVGNCIDIRVYELIGFRITIDDNYCSGAGLHIRGSHETSPWLWLFVLIAGIVLWTMPLNLPAALPHNAAPRG